MEKWIHQRLCQSFSIFGNHMEIWLWLMHLSGSLLCSYLIQTWLKSKIIDHKWNKSVFELTISSRVYRAAGSHPIRPGFDALRHVRKLDKLTQAAPGLKFYFFYFQIDNSSRAKRGRSLEILYGDRARLSFRMLPHFPPTPVKL